MPDFTIFYSWQSDLPNATNRGFIHDALEKACKDIASDSEVEDAPRLDQDTLGLPGAPAIPDAIMRKIDSCDAFVADVSLCYDGPNGKRSPNPNVLFELGYAIARLTWDRVVLLVNTEHGAIGDLPFDLEKRRALGYSASPGDTDRSDQKASLKQRLASSLKTIAKVGRPGIPELRRPADAAIAAIEELSSARKPRLREFWKWFLDGLSAHAPEERDDQGVETEIQILRECLGKALLFVAAYSRVMSAIARSNDRASSDFIAERLLDILVRTDTLPEDGRGYLKVYWWDYWRFLAHECFTTLIAHLLEEKRWELIGAILSHEYYWRKLELRTNSGAAWFIHLAQKVALLEFEGDRRMDGRMRAGLLRKRVGEISELGGELDFNQFVEADVFLAVASEARWPTEDYEPVRWTPFSAVGHNHRPAFISRSSHEGFARHISDATGAGSLDRLKDVTLATVKKLHARSNIYLRVQQSDVDAIASRS